MIIGNMKAVYLFESKDGSARRVRQFSVPLNQLTAPVEHLSVAVIQSKSSYNPIYFDAPSPTHSLAEWDSSSWAQ